MSVATPTSGVLTIPEADSHIPPTSVEELDAAVRHLDERRRDWIELPMAAKVTLLEECLHDAHAVVEEWADRAGPPKGIPPDSPYRGEDLATGPMMLVRHLRILKEACEQIRDIGRVRLPKEPYARPDGQVVVQTFPTGPRDMALIPMHKAEVWMQPHVTLDSLTTGPRHGHDGSGGVCFVLGAGNIPSIGACDALTRMFNHGEVCIIKMNPVNEHMGPIVEKAMSPFIREGYLRIVYGGLEQGKALTDHDLVTHIHMTASDKTHDAVVFGVGEEGAANKAANRRVIDTPVTSELGNVSPMIVVPAVLTDAEIEYQAKFLISMLVSNGGFNCGAGRIIITHPRWKQRGQLLDKIKELLAEVPYRRAYYPGAKDRWEQFVAQHPEALTYGPSDGDDVPWTFIPDLDPSDVDDIMFTTECFNGIFGEVAIDAPADVATWLPKVVDFCNETLWGTLIATILVKPSARKDPGVEAALDRAVADLRYGSIGVNCWGATSYGLISTTWGAFPGHPDNDIQSGQGVVHNSYMLHDPQKTVVWGPWKLGDKPPMSYDDTAFGSIARRLIEIEAKGDFSQVPKIVLDGIKG